MSFGTAQSHGVQFHATLRCCRCFFQMFEDQVWREEGNIVEKTEVGCIEECLHQWAGESLVHVFYSIFQMWHGVYIVSHVLDCGV